MKKGDSIRCVDASPTATQLVQGKVYTVKSTFVGPDVPQAATGDEPLDGMEDVPGVRLIELDGHFRQDRFVPERLKD